MEIDTVFEWVGYDIPNYMRKMRLKCCAAAEKMSVVGVHTISMMNTILNSLQLA
ncbi:MAG: hypothetical protein WCC17_24820 [Candidatus Nitrosopolaris sp.]